VIPIGTALSAGVPCAVLRLGGLEMDSPYAQAVAYYGFSAFLELLAEPFYIRAQRRSRFRLRFVTETMATVLRSLVTFYFVNFTERHVSLGFAFGQLAYGVTILICYAIAQLDFAYIGCALFLGKTKVKWGGTLRLVQTFSTQALLKLFLAEGEKGVLLMVGNADSQGVYGLVSSLGSLFVRIVLQPFEEIAFVAFSKKNNSQTTKRKKIENEAKVFATLMRVSGMLGLLVAVHGPLYSELAIRLLYGKQWADTKDVTKSLGAFSVMVLILALNGTSEAYAHAVMKPNELNGSNVALLSTSLLNIIMSIYLQPRVGPTGLIISNSISMCLRFAYTMSFVVNERFRGCKLTMATFFPHHVVCLAFIGSFVTTSVTSKLDMWTHILAGFVSVSGILMSILFYERNTLTNIVELKTRRKMD